jgi:hypothetical protein
MHRPNQRVKSLLVEPANFTYTFSASTLRPFSPPDSCGVDLPVLARRQPPDNPCPRWQYHGLGRKPGTHPQPQSDKCPPCNYVIDENPFFKSGSPAGVFYGEITGLSSGEHLENLTLILTSCDGGSPQRFYQPRPGPFYDGETIKISDLPKCDAVALSYTIHVGDDLQGSMTVPILVLEK